METPESPQPTPTESVDVPLLKPKQVRKLSDEQRAIRAESMRQVNAKRIEDARARNALKNPPVAPKAPPATVPAVELEVKAPTAPKKDKTTKKPSKKPRIKIITIESSSDDDDEDDSDSDSSDESLPDAKYVFLSKNSKKSKSQLPITKQREKSYPPVPPQPIVPPKPAHKFL